MKNKIASFFKMESKKDDEPCGGLNMLSTLEKDDILYIYFHGNISWYELDSEWFSAVIDQSQKKNIFLDFNCMGGSIHVGLGIYAKIKQLQSQGYYFTSHVSGYCHSMATIIFLACDKKTVYKASNFMIHKAWAEVRGTESDMRKEADSLEKTFNAMLDIYVQETGGDRKVVDKWCIEETYFVGDDIVNNGFADEVIAYDQVPVMKSNISEKQKQEIKSYMSKMQSMTARKPVVDENKRNEGDNPEGNKMALEVTQLRERNEKIKILMKNEGNDSEITNMLQDYMCSDFDTSYDVIVSQYNLNMEKLQKSKNQQFKANRNAVKEYFEPFLDSGDQAIKNIYTNCIADPEITVEEAAKKLQAHMQNDTRPLVKTYQAGLGFGDAVNDEFEQAVMMQMGVLSDDADTNENGLVEMSMPLKLLAYANSNGIRVNRLDEKSLSRMSNTTELPSVLEDITNKYLSQSVKRINQPWLDYSSRMAPSDFKETFGVDIVESSDAGIIGEDGRYERFNFRETKNGVKLAKYGGLVVFTWEAMLNDDIGAYQKMIRKAIGRTVERFGEKITEIFLTQSLYNSNNTFEVGYPTVAAIQEVDTEFSLMKSVDKKGKKGNSMKLMIEHCLCPNRLKHVLGEIVGSTTKSSQSNSNVRNTVENLFSIHPEIRFDERMINDDSTLDMFFMPNVDEDAIATSFLNGNPEPEVIGYELNNVDGVGQKIRFSAGCAPMQFNKVMRGIGPTLKEFLEMRQREISNIGTTNPTPVE